METRITCPCCNKELIVYIDGEHTVAIVHLDTVPDTELNKVLEKIKIEFG
jgi:hypothetical protein